MKSLTSQIIALLLQEMQDEISKTPQPVIVDVNISKMSISTITTQSTSLKKQKKEANSSALSVSNNTIGTGSSKG
jgi:hypothetical protein